ncbi:uncharacterized protein [Mytilus edulis]|uniref:uncharacterized protein n=1 Tax=Mytilus edulis TaxID=6550 RepID=UPI0039F0FDB1
MGLGEGSGCRPRARAKKDRKYIPAMPMPLAVICCILNFLVPGIGTIIAGFCVCCCARNEDMTCCDKFCSFFLSVLFGLLQIILAPILFVGWVWSCFWGVSFIGMSKEYYHDNKPFDDAQPNTVVTSQPGVNPHNLGQWSSPPGGPYGGQPGPSQGYYPQGGQYPGQTGPGPGYFSGGHTGYPQGQSNQSPIAPSAPPAEDNPGYPHPGYHEPPPGYHEPPPGYHESPPPYDVNDPHPKK